MKKSEKNNPCNISWLCVLLSRPSAPAIQTPARRKFGRIWQRFWLVRRSGLLLNGLPRWRRVLFGLGFSFVRMKEHDA
jgi:hypothetical protein